MIYHLIVFSQTYALPTKCPKKGGIRKLGLKLKKKIFLKVLKIAQIREKKQKKYSEPSFLIPLCMGHPVHDTYTMDVIEMIISNGRYILYNIQKQLIISKNKCFQ